MFRPSASGGRELNGVRVAFVVCDGVPVEFLEYDTTD